MKCDGSSHETGGGSGALLYALRDQRKIEVSEAKKWIGISWCGLRLAKDTTAIEAEVVSLLLGLALVDNVMRNNDESALWGLGHDESKSWHFDEVCRIVL